MRPPHHVHMAPAEQSTTPNTGAAGSYPKLDDESDQSVSMHQALPYKSVILLIVWTRRAAYFSIEGRSELHVPCQKSSKPDECWRKRLKQAPGILVPGTRCSSSCTLLHGPTTTRRLNHVAVFQPIRGWNAAPSSDRSRNQDRPVKERCEGGKASASSRPSLLPAHSRSFNVVCRDALSSVIRAEK